MRYKLQLLPDVAYVKNIFFVGIKGVGVAPLAIISKQAGFNIAGSDIADTFITDEPLNNEEIIVFEGFDIDDVSVFFEHFESQECLVVTTGAHKGFDNSQVKWAKEKGINVITQGQALGIFMNTDFLGKDFDGVSIAGSHGKTTISALLSSTLVSLDQDPTYSVGTGEIFPVGSPGHLGEGNLFIAEADEYSSEPIYDIIPKFLYQTPKYAIFNNIDFDHPDLFKDVEEVKEAFLEFSNNIKSNGVLFINGDDKRLVEIKKNINKDIRVVSYGKNDKNDYYLGKYISEGLESKFTVYKNGNEIGVFDLNVPGEHNALNSLAVISFLFEIGFDVSQIRTALKSFKGSKRRMEFIGKTQGGAIVMDDYGHHPLEIKSTVNAIKNAFPERKIICIFQSHTYSRTRSLLSDFSESFNDAFQLLLLPIFKSQRDTEKDIITNDEFLQAFSGKVKAKLIDNFDDMIKYIHQNFNSQEYIVLTIGAGDLNKIAYKLV